MKKKRNNLEIANIFYEMAEKLIKMKKAYVCKCDREIMQKLREEGKECKCTKNSVEKILEEWKNMLAGKYEEGQAILRLSADMTSENHVMRDPVLFRVNKTAHYRQKNKYYVWPMYDIENSIEDSITGITHILRSSEFGSMRIELQDYIKELLGLSKQTIIQYGRFNVSGATTKGREIREKIEAGDVSGWDDPSLVTLKALKRRGFVKETFYELVYEVGLSANTGKNLDWSLINSINRSLLDEKASRYFFIENPVKIKVKDAPHIKAELSLHPGHPELGIRELETKGEFYISKQDKEKFKEHDLIRLMECLNFEVKGNEFIFHSKEHEHYKEKGSMIIHWLPASHNLVNVEVRMPNNEIKKGFAEEGAKKLNEGAIIQFTRFGFCRLDEKKDDKLVFWFTTK
jgi:glutamyl-tRNA synthetase